MVQAFNSVASAVSCGSVVHRGFRVFRSIFVSRNVLGFSTDEQTRPFTHSHRTLVDRDQDDDTAQLDDNNQRDGGPFSLPLRMLGSHDGCWHPCVPADDHRHSPKPGQSTTDLRPCPVDPHDNAETNEWSRPLSYGRKFERDSHQ